MEPIELRGPQVVAQPAQAFAMQEARVIMPEPKVAVGKGFDWDAVGKAVAELGTQAISYLHEDKAAKQENVLNRVAQDVEKRVNLALENGDMKAYDDAISTYKGIVKNETGYDFDSVPAGRLPQQLMDKARQSFYRWSDIKDKNERDVRYAEKANELERLSTETGLQVQQAYENGQWDKADALLKAHKEKVAAQLGLKSLEDDVPMGIGTKTLLSKVNNDLTKWSYLRGVAAQEYQGMAELSSADTISNRFRDALSKAKTQDEIFSITADYKLSVEKLHKDEFGVELFDNVPSGLTKQSAALRARLQSHYLDADVELAKAMKANKPADPFERVSDTVLNYTQISKSAADSAEKAFATVKALREADPTDPTIAKVQAEAVAHAHKAMQYREMAYASVGSVMEQRQGGANKPVVLFDPNDPDAMNMLAQSLPSTVFDNLQAMDSNVNALRLNEIGNIAAQSRDLEKRVSEARDTYIKTMGTEAHGFVVKMADEAKKNPRMKMAYETLARQRAEKLKKDLIGQLLTMSGSRELLDNALIARHPYSYGYRDNPDGNLVENKFDVLFDLETMESLNPFTNPREAASWTKAIDELRMVTAAIGTIRGDSSNKKKPDFDPLSALSRHANGYHVDLTPERVDDMVVSAFDQLGISLLDENGNTRDWREISDAIAALPRDAYIPFHLFARSPAFESLVVSAMNSADPNYGYQEIGKLQTGPSTTSPLSYNDRRRLEAMPQPLPPNSNLDVFKKVVSDNWHRDSAIDRMVPMFLMLDKEDRDQLVKYVAGLKPEEMTTNPADQYRFKTFASSFQQLLSGYNDRTGGNVKSYMEAKKGNMLSLDSFNQLKYFDSNIAGTQSDNQRFRSYKSNPQVSADEKTGYELLAVVREISAGIKLGEVKLDGIIQPNSNTAARSMVDSVIAQAYIEAKSLPGDPKKTAGEKASEILAGWEWKENSLQPKARQTAVGQLPRETEFPRTMAAGTRTGMVLPMRDLVVQAPIPQFKDETIVQFMNPLGPSASKEDTVAAYKKDVESGIRPAVAIAVNTGALSRIPSPSGKEVAVAALDKLIPEHEASPMHILAAKAALANATYSSDPTKWASDIEFAYNKAMTELRKSEFRIEENPMIGNNTVALPTVVMRSGRNGAVAHFQPRQDLSLNQDLSMTEWFQNRISKMTKEELSQAYLATDPADVDSRDLMVATWMETRPGETTFVPDHEVQWTWFSPRFMEYSPKEGPIVYAYKWMKDSNGVETLYRLPMSNNIENPRSPTRTGPGLYIQSDEYARTQGDYSRRVLSTRRQN